MTAAYDRLVNRALAQAALLDLDDVPLFETVKLLQISAVELLMLLAELEEPTAVGISERRPVALGSGPIDVRRAI